MAAIIDLKIKEVTTYYTKNRYSSIYEFKPMSIIDFFSNNISFSFFFLLSLPQSQSTNEQYPFRRCFYDSLELMRRISSSIWFCVCVLVFCVMSVNFYQFVVQLSVIRLVKFHEDHCQSFTTQASNKNMSCCQHFLKL